jgi:cytochrome b561
MERLRIWTTRPIYGGLHTNFTKENIGLSSFVVTAKLRAKLKEPLEIHRFLVNMPIALVVVHVLGALKHQFAMKGNIMGRMSSRKRK